MNVRKIKDISIGGMRTVFTGEFTVLNVSLRKEQCFKNIGPWFHFKERKRRACENITTHQRDLGSEHNGTPPLIH